MSKLFELLQELGKYDGGASLKIQTSGGVAIFTPRSQKGGTTLILAESEAGALLKLLAVINKRRKEKQ
jgi:hypothetical protein